MFLKPALLRRLCPHRSLRQAGQQCLLHHPASVPSITVGTRSFPPRLCHITTVEFITKPVGVIVKRRTHLGHPNCSTPFSVRSFQHLWTPRAGISKLCGQILEEVHVTAHAEPLEPRGVGPLEHPYGNP